MSAKCGTYYGYQRGCRCDGCRTAKREYTRRWRGGVSMEEYRQRLREQPTKTQHGTIGRYWRHGCRCDVCRAGNAERMRVWRASKRRVAS